MYAYTGGPQPQYPMAGKLSFPPNQIVLLTIPVSSLKSLGLKKPIDIVAHWTICINECCYELGRQIGNKKEPYAYRWLRRETWQKHREDQNKQIEPHILGEIAMPYSHQLIDEVAQMVWELSLKKKYAFDDRNCQVFIRLLVELIGSPLAKTEFPAFLDSWVKAAGNTRDGSIFTAAAGMVTIAAISVGSLAVDPTGITAAGFAIAAQTALRSSAWLLTERDLKGKLIQKGQKQIREDMKRRGRPLAE